MFEEGTPDNSGAESEEESGSDESEDEEVEDSTPPNPSQRKTSKAASFSKSLKRCLSSSSSDAGKKKPKLKHTLKNLIGVARTAVTLGAAKKETNHGLKSKPPSKKEKSSKSSAPSKIQKKEGGKKGKKENPQSDDLTFMKVGLLCLLPYGVVENSDLDTDSDSDKESSEDEDSDKPSRVPQLPPGVGTQKDQLLKLDVYNLVRLAGDGDNAIEVPSSGTHEQLVKEIFHFFPEALSYVIKNDYSPPFYVCTRNSKGGRHPHTVCPNPLPDGTLVSHSCITSRTSWKDRQLVITTSRPIPQVILDGWMAAKLAEVKTPKYNFELMDTPEIKRTASSSKATLEEDLPLTFFDDDDELPSIPDLIQSTSADSTKRKSAKRKAKGKGKEKEKEKEKIGKGKEKEVIEVPSGSENGFNESDEDDLGDPWGTNRNYSIYSIY